MRAAPEREKRHGRSTPMCVETRVCDRLSSHLSVSELLFVPKVPVSCPALPCGGSSPQKSNVANLVRSRATFSFTHCQRHSLSHCNPPTAGATRTRLTSVGAGRRALIHLLLAHIRRKPAAAAAR